MKNKTLDSLLSITNPTKEETLAIYYWDVLDTLYEKGEEKTSNYKKWEEKLSQLGYEYTPPTYDASIEKHYDITDFSSFKEYKNYCQERYSYKFKTVLYKYDRENKKVSEYLTEEEIISIKENLGIEIKEDSSSHGTEEAYAVGNKIFMSTELGHTKFTIIHELGHVFDDFFIKGKNNPANDMAESVSSYGILNASECFAESFLFYFTNPSFLEECNKEGYDFLDKKIPSLWKKTIYNLLK